MIKQKPNFVLHREVMFDILKDIYSSDLSDKLAFKGGTLCMFVHQLDRFSVDLDFDLHTETFEQIRKTLIPLLQKYGNIVEQKNTKVLLRYKDGNYPLKIEINTRIQHNDSYVLTPFFGTTILAMDQASMFANKLYTLYQRKERADKVASRDLYDVRFFFTHHRPINHELLEERSGQTVTDFLGFLESFIPANYHKQNILLGLGELVSEKQKYFIKNKLIQEVLSQIDFYLRNQPKKT